MKYISICLLITILMTLRAQAQKETRIGISVNSTYLYLGGGDLNGFSYTTFLQRFFSKHLSAEVEYRIATARQSPGFARSFSDKTLHFLESKMAYYPFRNLTSQGFRRYVEGVHVAVGVGFAQGRISEEQRWISYYDSAGNEIGRESLLGLRKVSAFSYGVKIGYQVYVSRKIFTGVRIDWSHSEIDGYAGFGLYLGTKL